MKDERIKETEPYIEPSHQFQQFDFPIAQHIMKEQHFPFHTHLLHFEWRQNGKLGFCHQKPTL
jgi:hypothetical protein